MWDVEEPTHYSKRVRREVSRCCGYPLCCLLVIGEPLGRERVNPCFVVFTFGSDSVLLPLKSYLLFLILTSSLMHVGGGALKTSVYSY